MQMRMVLLPKGLNEWGVTRLSGRHKGEQEGTGTNAPVWNRVKPRSGSEFVVAVCCDAGNECSNYCKGNLQELFGSNAVVKACSFFDDSAEKVVSSCDVFYMGGGCPSKYEQMGKTKTFAHLAQRVRAGHCLYIGVCGGAKISCRQYGEGLFASITGLGLLDFHIDLANTNDGPVAQNKVLLTPRTGMVVHGKQSATFITTKSGICKNLREAHTLQAQLQELGFLPMQEWLSHHDTYVPRLPDTGVPSPPNVPPPNTRVPPAPDVPSPPPDAGVRPTHVLARHIFTCREGLDHKVEISMPLDLTQLQVIVLYIPGCQLERPRDPFVPSHDAHSAVLYPIIESTGGNGKAYKRPLPDWIFEWVLREHLYRPNLIWSLLGFSRGASWALLLLKRCIDRGMIFDRVLLVAPYLAGAWDVELKSSIKQALVTKIRKRIKMVWGENDPWPEPELLFDNTLKANVHLEELPGIGHEGALNWVYERELVHRLTTTDEQFRPYRLKEFGI